ncbi:MAG TPA: TetR/AcrR family transcriptional regulator [Hyphomonas sp.]|jgi:AcrR family transcriptional regulator|uniref:Transcriptional regulator, TetR family n=3 Tax=root TaxID=1 RepID=A0A160TVQ6_9ZZZZ|nr:MULTISPECIES: TetR/AcrR family transcriptional regulator [unclassified Hyphomonas]MAA82550.1 TetR family transcriptional regulator [Hyphomonas sp.]MAL46179.1 TetR family transcriptional regulator [Hyphomonas sp.]MAX83073.1 TetR family transcriptional regulator [Hyphomonas sp.]MBG68274.1 TetR family transcriptional regulator [Hyphomonas sp.]MBO6583039.1 TetR/AcrR family transcriptional regulator [Hyphomonas sp.]|tara:strand:+ start:13374 stop:14000 length:627 start_codon:yes stop_codon:yes gene_type:complete
MSSIVKTLAGSTGKRARSKAANRRAILQAGRRVFARIGFEATTVRDIIRETELAAGTFYNYFKSKEEVFEAIAEDSTHRFRSRLQDVRAYATDFETYVHDAYRAYFGFIATENEEPIRNGAPHLALIGVRVDTPEMLAVAEEIRADLEHVLSGEGGPKIDTAYLTAAAIGIAREMGEHMLLRRPVDVDGATEFATALLLAGVREIAAK